MQSREVKKLRTVWQFGQSQSVTFDIKIIEIICKPDYSLLSLICGAEIKRKFSL